MFFRLPIRSWFRGIHTYLSRRRVLTLSIILLTLVVLTSSRLVFAAIATNSPPPPSVPIPGNVPSAITHASRQNVVPANQTIALSVSLRLSNLTQLKAFIAGQNESTAVQYHKYLTPQQFTAQFGPTQANVDAVKAFLHGAGFTVTSVASNRMLIDVVGTVAQANKAFGTTLYNYTLDQRQVMAPENTPTMPQNLAAIIQNVSGLNTLEVSHPIWLDAKNHVPAQPTHPQQANLLDPHPRTGFSPSNLRDAYQVTTLINSGGNGSTERIAVFEQGPYIPNDVNTYRATYGLPNSPVFNYAIDGASATGDASGTLEADLDLEVVSALSPNATIDVLTGPNTMSAANDLYNLFVTLNQDTVLTTSWGQCEPQTSISELNTLDNIFMEAAAQGQSILAASGDTGSDDCFNRDTKKPSGLPPSVDSPADDPYVIGVGGTTLNFNGSYGGETVWNAHGVAGGGGVSSYFSKPKWQTGIGVNNPYATNQREVPDITGVADQAPGFNTFCTSKPECTIGGVPIGWAIVGGTSATAPLFAGVMADLNTYLRSHSASPMGWANQKLYELYSYSVTDRNATFGMFNDIVSGNNDLDYGSTSYSGDYPATSCFDLASGMGSLNAWHIAQVLIGGPSNTKGPCASPVSGGDTPGVFRSTTTAFYLRNSLTTGQADETITLGAPGDIPVAGDWTGSGVDTIGVYRPSTATFSLKNSNDPAAPVAYTFTLGNPGDLPMVGDWTGSGHDGVGVFRPTNGLIYLKNNLTTGFADYTMVLGIPGDRPVAGDWTHSGHDSPGVYRPSTAQFYLSNHVCNCSVQADYAVTLGLPGDEPFAGDWTNSGYTGLGVFRPTNGQIYMRNDPTTSGFADYSLVLGIPNDQPIAGHWIKQ